MSGAEPGSVERIPGAGGPETAPPAVNINAGKIVRSARVRADLSDLLDLSILLGINLMFKGWETAHIPFLTRETSMAILLSANALYVLDWLVTRYLPQWRARRVASTWSPNERARARL